ncbi:hypothetical protein DH2020_028962 [Rehmannia glutinosa]|uniref:Uncharacterized protein n=1 Tax=Rehmannia glutinosa TaxID=99300 RepID=A0ABR0VU66_REHGL
MAYRRSITARAKLFYQQQHRVAPSFSHIDRDDSDREDLCTNSISRSPEPCNYFQHRLLGSRNNFSTYHGSRNVFQGRRFAIPAGCGLVLGRNFSSGSVGEGAAEKIEILNDMVGVLGDKAVEVAPVANEVAVAAADSFFRWASIAVTTLLIRSCQLPLIVNQLKSTTKFTLLRPKLEAIKEEMQDRDMSPNAVAEGQARMKKLFKEYVNNMAEKVPSFKEGGAFWFTDLTTPDTMYIFPVLTALTFWITVECNAQEGLEGNPTAGTIKNVSRVFAALTIPFTASFPKKPKVKKFFGIPSIPVPPPVTPSTDQKPGFSFLKH